MCSSSGLARRAHQFEKGEPALPDEHRRITSLTHDPCLALPRPADTCDTSSLLRFADTQGLTVSQGGPHLHGCAAQGLAVVGRGAYKALGVGTLTRHRRVLAGLVGLSLVLKLSAFAAIWRVDPQRVVTGDTASYENPARALVATGRFAAGPDRTDEPETLRTPGYPLFLAALYASFGERRDLVVVAQVLLSSATVLLLYGLGTRLSTPGAALAAAALLVLDPLSFVYSQLLFSESLFTCVLLVAAWCAVAQLRGGPLWWSGLFGLSLAAATLIRPIAYYLIAPSLVGLVLYGRTGLGWTRREVVAAALLLLLPWCILVEGWRVRNFRATGSAAFSHIQAYNLLWYRGAGIVAIRDGVSFEEAQTRTAASLPDMTGWSATDVNARYASEGLRLIRDHPVPFLRNQLFGLGKIVAGPGRSDLEHYVAGIPYATVAPEAVRLSGGGLTPGGARGLASRLATVYSVAYLALLYSAVGWGLVATRRRDAAWAGLLFLGGVGLYLLVMAAGPESYARFRVPVTPILALFAGCGWDAVCSTRRRAG